jgi:hypothetical protein
LRHRPDRIIVGEVRGGDAFDLLQALNPGHAGTLSTIHANSAQQARSRLASCVLQAGVELPYQAIRHQVGDSINVVLHLERHRGMRTVSELIRVADVVFTTMKRALRTALAPRDQRIAALEKEIAELKARPVVHDAGVWTHGKVYEPGAIVSHRGSGWICSAAHLSTGDDLNHEHFRLFVKAGRDARGAR